MRQLTGTESQKACTGSVSTDLMCSVASQSWPASIKTDCIYAVKLKAASCFEQHLHWKSQTMSIWLMSLLLGIVRLRESHCKLECQRFLDLFVFCLPESECNLLAPLLQLHETCCTDMQDTSWM